MGEYGKKPEQGQEPAVDYGELNTEKDYNQSNGNQNQGQSIPEVDQPDIINVINNIKRICDEEGEKFRADLKEAKAEAKEESKAKAKIKTKVKEHYSKLDPYADEIVRRLRLGLSVSTIAKQCDISRKGLYDFFRMRGIDWKDVNPENFKIHMKTSQNIRDSD